MSRYASPVVEDHPVAREYGMAAPHRIALYDAIGPSSHPCHWCGREVFWAADCWEDLLHVDHLDDDGHNNDPANLVASCGRCNSWRGRWPESFARFVAPVLPL